MTDVDPARVRARLEADERETRERLESMQGDFAGVVDAQADVATDDEHDPEGATIAFERARVAALVDQARQHLADIDAAVSRLDDGSYGSCERCGRPIEGERLAARPVARTCMTCASRRR